MRSRVEDVDDLEVIDAEMLGLENIIEIEFILLSQLYREVLFYPKPARKD